MRGSIATAVLLVLLLFPFDGGGIQATDNLAEPNRFFRDFIGLNEDQIRAIREGKAIAKILDSPTADQVFVFGSVYINSTPETLPQVCVRHQCAPQASELYRASEV